MDDVTGRTRGHVSEIGVRLLAAVVMAACVALTGCNGNGIEREGHDATVDNRFVSENTDWEYETVTDSQTGIVYLVFDAHNGNSNFGGITPLLKRDGSVTIDDRYGE